MLVFLFLAAGCSKSTERPARIDTTLAWGTTIAVAPALNFSGSAGFDPVRVADLMASELADVEGVGVIGVNRVLAVLAEQGVVQIQSPDHAVLVCERIGADAILVFAITEYDAYRPIVGIVAQLYGRRTEAAQGGLGTAEHGGQPVPWAQVQRVFNGAHDKVRSGVKEYARHRSADRSPYGWRKYLASQELFLRFCSASVVREMMEHQPLAWEGPGPAGRSEHGFSTPHLREGFRQVAGQVEDLCKTRRATFAEQNV